MREILFRGKSEFNGEWVYGYYYMAKYYRSEPELYDYITIPHPEAHNAPSEHIPVIHETVGQYTGLTDKNGMKIFEGDLVFDGDSACLVKWEYRNYEYILDDGETSYNMACISSSQVEIVGNIHDNPELLGGADNGESAD